MSFQGLRTFIENPARAWNAPEIGQRDVWARENERFDKEASFISAQNAESRTHEFNMTGMRYDRAKDVMSHAGTIGGEFSFHDNGGVNGIKVAAPAAQPSPKPESRVQSATQGSSGGDTPPIMVRAPKTFSTYAQRTASRSAAPTQSGTAFTRPSAPKSGMSGGSLATSALGGRQWA